MKPRIIRKMNKSHYATISPEMCKEAGIAEGSFVNMSVDGNKIIITPVVEATTPETGAIAGAPVKEIPAHEH